MQSYSLFFETFQPLTLYPYTDFYTLKGAETLKLYRASAKPSMTFRSGMHCGTLQQALIRADYMVNDEEKYEEYYLYEIVYKMGSVYPELVPDDGTDHTEDVHHYIEKGYDTLVYKNTGEGDIKNNNLSIIILNHSNIRDSNKTTLTKEYLQSIRDILYAS
jgi:hypothetical protein